MQRDFSNGTLKGVIFDMDGVLIDSHNAHRETWRRFHEHLGRQVTERDLDFILEGRKREEILNRFLGELTREQIEEYGALKDQLFQESADKIRVVNGLPDLLNDLRSARIQMGVATSANAVRAHNMLKKLGLYDFFDTIVTGNDVQNGKPDPALFHEAATRMGLQTHEVLVIEDAVAGVHGARCAGIRCFAIAPKERIQALEQAGAEIVCSDFQSLNWERISDLFQRGCEQ